MCRGRRARILSFLFLQEQIKGIIIFRDIYGAWFGLGSGFGIGFTLTLLLARALLLLAPLLSHTIPFPRVH